LSAGKACRQFPKILFFPPLGGSQRIGTARFSDLLKAVSELKTKTPRPDDMKQEKSSYPPNAQVGNPWIFVRMRNNPPESGYFANCPASISFRAEVTYRSVRCGPPKAQDETFRAAQGITSSKAVWLRPTWPPTAGPRNRRSSHPASPGQALRR
jgi:hypothetical protein